MFRKFSGGIVAFLLILLFCCPAGAEGLRSHVLTEELARVKTQHDNGFQPKVEIAQNDLHFGWGLGEFFLQGYSDMTSDGRGTPVFLLKEDDQISLGFRLTQDLNALNGNGKLKISSDSNGFDKEFEVKEDFGRGCLILRRTDRESHVEQIVRTDYLSSVEAGAAEAFVGPLKEGSYRAVLDYEIQSPGTLGTSAFSDYRIEFEFKIKTSEDYYELLAAATAGISPSGTHTAAIIVAVAGLLVGALILFIVIRKRSAGSEGMPASGDPLHPGMDDGAAALAQPPASGRRRNRVRTDAGKSGTGRITAVVAFALVIVVFVAFVGPWLSAPSTYTGTIRYLDERLSKANLLMIGTASASFIISVFPDDMGTPIANELAKLSGYMLLIMSAILLEKYLLTSIGFVASMIVIPAACLLGIVSAFYQGELKKKLVSYTVKLFILGICIALIIPLGCLCGRAIEDVNRESINNAIEDAEQANKIVDTLPEEEGDKNLLQQALSGIMRGLKNQVEWAKGIFSHFMSSVAVMLITTIVIPVIIVFTFVLLIRFLTRRDFTGLIRGFSRRFAEGSARRLTRGPANRRSGSGPAGGSEA